MLKFVFTFETPKVFHADLVMQYRPYYAPHRGCCFMAHFPTSISLLWHPWHPELGCSWVTFFTHNLAQPTPLVSPCLQNPCELVRKHEEAWAGVLFRYKALFFNWPKGLHVGELQLYEEFIACSEVVQLGAWSSASNRRGDWNVLQLGPGSLLSWSWRVTECNI